MFGSQPGRADARRNVQRILDATAELIATDPGASMEQIAARAGVSRATLYHHFPSRDALLDRLTDRSIGEVRAALESAQPGLGSATEAVERMLVAAWPVIGRYRGLVMVNQRLDRAELRARLEPAVAPLRSVVRRGQQHDEFDPELPTDWLISILIDIVHAAGRQVTAGTMDPEAAERALLRSATATVASHR
jgi:AcrR family transcriptional regulator